jgi:hypothetical protein
MKYFRAFMGPYCEAGEGQNSKQSVPTLNSTELFKSNSIRPSINSYVKNNKEDDYCRQSLDLQVLSFFLAFFNINFSKNILSSGIGKELTFSNPKTSKSKCEEKDGKKKFLFFLKILVFLLVKFLPLKNLF